MSGVAETGVYYGYSQITPSSGSDPISDEDRHVFPMVMSLGWNPFYKNERMTAVRLFLLTRVAYPHFPCRRFTSCMSSNPTSTATISKLSCWDTSGQSLITHPEVRTSNHSQIITADCFSEALIDDIETDKHVALNCLARPNYEKYSKDDFFSH
jgi:riboflavin kinase